MYISCEHCSLNARYIVCDSAFAAGAGTVAAAFHRGDDENWRSNTTNSKYCRRFTAAAAKSSVTAGTRANPYTFMKSKRS